AAGLSSVTLTSRLSHPCALLSRFFTRQGSAAHAHRRSRMQCRNTPATQQALQLLPRLVDKKLIHATEMTERTPLQAIERARRAFDAGKHQRMPGELKLPGI